MWQAAAGMERLKFSRRCCTITSTIRRIIRNVTIMFVIIGTITTTKLFGLRNNSIKNYNSCYAFVPTSAPRRLIQQQMITAITTRPRTTGSNNYYNNIPSHHHHHHCTNTVRVSSTGTKHVLKSISPMKQCENDFQLTTPSNGNYHYRWYNNLSNIRQHVVRNLKQRCQTFQSSSSWTSKYVFLFLWHSIRRAIVVVTLALLISFHHHNVVPVVPIPTANAAVSGGRMGGGSFKVSPPSRTSSSRTRTGRVSTLSRPSLPTQQSQKRGRVYSSPNPMLHTPIIINSYSGSNGWYAPTRESAMITSRVSTKDIILVTGTGMLLAYGYNNNRLRNNNNDNNHDDGTDSLLGSGYTVGSMTVSMDVPDRSSLDNILHKLNQLALSADTMTKKGLQDLLSAVTLELLRHEQSITSAYAQSRPYPIIGQAEREFQILSVASQSKVDRLTVNKWNAPAKSDVVSTSTTTTTAPTVAIVTINFAMEGDSTILPSIKSRDDVHTALSLIASDALVGECLMTAEILWSPEHTSETLSREATYADFPNLVPI